MRVKKRENILLYTDKANFAAMFWKFPAVIALGNFSDMLFIFLSFHSHLPFSILFSTLFSASLWLICLVARFEGRIYQFLIILTSWWGFQLWIELWDFDRFDSNSNNYVIIECKTYEYASWELFCRKTYIFYTPSPPHQQPNISTQNFMAEKSLLRVFCISPKKWST